MSTTGYFSPDRVSLVTARRFVREAAHNLGLVPSDADALVVIADRLVEDAIESESSDFRLDVVPADDSVRIEIWRPSLAPEAASMALRDQRIAGRSRGLQLIQDLARNWGAIGLDEGGTTIWAEVPRVSGRSVPPETG